VPSRTQAFERIAQGGARYYQLPMWDDRYTSNGADRAKYGSQVLEHLGRELQKSLDKYYTGRYLRLCRPTDAGKRRISKEEMRS
jgi:predicted metal-dependent phosphoesterase TrpH